MANLHSKAQFIKVKRGEYHGHCIGNSFCQLFAASQASIQSLYTSAGSDKSEEMEINNIQCHVCWKLQTNQLFIGNFTTAGGG